MCPVQGAVSFIDSYGAPRSGGRAHKGVDMLAARGTPTVAPVSGTVTHRGNGIGGLSWHLNGDDGNYYYGTHLDSYANQGAGHVQAGTVIGYVGDTGNADGHAPPPLRDPPQRRRRREPVPDGAEVLLSAGLHVGGSRRGAGRRARTGARRRGPRRAGGRPPPALGRGVPRDLRLRPRPRRGRRSAAPDPPARSAPGR